MKQLVNLDNVAKIYPRVHRSRERLQAFGSLLLGREPSEGQEVLSGISLNVHAGESLGIIGENGAGKSTLLKILTGVIQPSRGSVTVDARIAALLELGAGFQPDFSGMDNVRMKASLLGMTTRELDQKMDQILAFADIGNYVHEPVKHYSSGMVVRLGFAVVAASRPELLITDEVLAVGDESFQKKCIRWIDGFIEDGGTLLFVSHSMYLVQKLCRNVLWLHEGKSQAYGEAHQVTQEYLTWHEERLTLETAKRRKKSGEEGRYRVDSLELSGALDSDTHKIHMHKDLEAELVLHSPDGRTPVSMIGLVRADGTPVYGISSESRACTPMRDENNPNNFRYRIRFPELCLLPGQYMLRGHALDPEGMRVCDTVERSFRVMGETADFGLVKLNYEWLE